MRRYNVREGHPRIFLCDAPKAIAFCDVAIGSCPNVSSYQEDSDDLSVVSSYCDVSGVRPGHGESSLCILSPECELYICDGDDDDSTDRWVISGHCRFNA